MIDEVWPECGHRAFFRNLMEKAVDLSAKGGDDLPAGIRPAAYAYEPYFQGLIPAGVYCGVSGYWGATQFNRFCTEHFDYSKYDSRKLSSYHGVYAEKPSPLTTETAMLPQDDRRRREREAIV